jgi:hypothetical protein
MGSFRIRDWPSRRWGVWNSGLRLMAGGASFIGNDRMSLLSHFPTILPKVSVIMRDTRHERQVMTWMGQLLPSNDILRR